MRRRLMLRNGLTLAICALALVVAPATAAAANKPLRIGFNDALVGPANDAQVVDLHRRLGVTVWRHSAAWRQVQPQSPDAFDWAYLDRVDARIRSLGAGWIALVIGTPGWAQGSRPLGPCFLDGNRPACQRPPDAGHLPDLRRYAQELVARYSNIVAVEVYNEPNVGETSWQPTADPAHYAAVLRAVHDGVKAARASVPVLIGGLTFAGLGVGGAMDPGDFLAGVYGAGGASAFDGIGIHPYPGAVEPTSQRSWHHLTNAIRVVRNEAGDAATPLWITETGYTTTGPFAVSPETQAAWLPAIVRDAVRAPDIAAVVVHTLRDRPGGALESPETGFGVVDALLAPKPAFDALRATFAELKAEAAKKAKAKKKKKKKRKKRRRRTSGLR